VWQAVSNEPWLAINGLDQVAGSGSFKVRDMSFKDTAPLTLTYSHIYDLADYLN
jgi:hypothetical protein